MVTGSRSASASAATVASPSQAVGAYPTPLRAGADPAPRWRSCPGRYPVPYALALVITLAVEVPVYVVCSVSPACCPVASLGGAIGVNLVTHPLVWLVLSAHPGWFVPVEAAVCAVEAVLLWLLARHRDLATLLLAAVVANTASVLAGFVLYGLTG